ncbi:hypothetical protein TIFTF001_055276 [Ficus carica]|uniref:Uncharacterized protein n=1 Tax=Ficus carica TaxID=3494 RepID=A0AA88EDA9_FICCA|nr:hypothetical protein TIFTF001_055276 [Ficus carica]
MSVWSVGGGWRRSRDKDSTVVSRKGTVTGAAWADHDARDLVVVGKVLLGLVPWSPMVICSRFSKERVDQSRSGRSWSSHIWSDASPSKVYDMWQLHATCHFLVGERSERPSNYAPPFSRLNPIL